MTGLWLVSYIALWLLFLVVAIILLSTLRNLGALYEVVNSLMPDSKPIKLVAGEVLPDLMLQTISGEALPISKFQGVATAFTIVSPGCVPCHDLLHDIAVDDTIDLPQGAERLVIVSLADASATADITQKIGLPSDVPVLVASRADMEMVWGITSTPTTVIVDDRLAFVGHDVGFRARRAQSVALAMHT